MKKIITFLVILTTSILSAQAPQKMSYQAVLRNTSNALISNTLVGMRISILQGSVTGDAVYVETQNPTTNGNGLVSLEIGGGSTVTGMFSTINWANGPFFIKTETDPTGGVNYSITGTTQLLSVPYALYAQSSKQQGKTTIILANDITDAQAAAQIAQELGPNTENIIIKNTTQLTTVDFSAVTSLIDITISNNIALTNVNFNSLTKLYGSLIIDSNNNLSSLSMNNLTESQSLYVISNPNLSSLLFNSLTKLYGNITIESNNNLGILSLINLVKSGDIYIDNNNISSISFNNLINCGFIYIKNHINLTSISFNSLTNCGDIEISGNTVLSTIYFNNLLNSGLISISGNVNLTSISFNNLTNLSNTVIDSDAITINDNTNLNNISIPNLSHLTGKLNIQQNPNLTIVTLTNLLSSDFINIYNNISLTNVTLTNLLSSYGIQIYNNSLTNFSLPSLNNIAGNHIIDLSSNKLSSSSVNSFLHKLLTVTPSSGKSIGLSGQNPPAPPTGQGILDKTTLINSGNSVITD